MLRLLGGRQLVGFSTTAALIGGLLLVVGSGSGYAASAEVRASDASASRPRVVLPGDMRSRAALSLTRTFNDPADDQNGMAPDLTNVVVSNDPSGNLVFAVSIRNYNAVRPRVSFTVLVDADRDARSGLDGADYLLTSGCQLPDRCGAGSWRWNGVNWDSANRPSYSSAFASLGPGGVMRFRIDNSDLGGTTWFNFTVNAYWFVSEPLNYDSDRAPDNGSTWTYKLETSASRADADRDGVVDSRDRCPRARGLYDINKNGCTGPFRRMHPDLKFRALGYSSYVTMASARIEDLPSGAQVEVHCRSACSVRQRQAARAPVVVLTQLRGTRLKRGSVVEIRVVKPGWIGYYARIEIRGSPLATQTTELCLPAVGKRVATPCNRVERGS